MPRLQHERAGMRGEYKQWRNTAQGYDTAFATTTVLAFVPVFAAPAFADHMTRLLLSDCAYFGVALDAFVVMPEHVHALLRLPQDPGISVFMQSLKRRSAKEIGALVPVGMSKRMEAEGATEGRQFWQRSFRSVPLDNEPDWLVKVEYTHNNPLKYGLAEVPSEYRWSSARWVDEGLWDEERGLPVARLLEHYAVE